MVNPEPHHAFAALGWLVHIERDGRSFERGLLCCQRHRRAPTTRGVPASTGNKMLLLVIASRPCAAAYWPTGWTASSDSTPAVAVAAVAARRGVFCARVLAHFKDLFCAINEGEDGEQVKKRKESE